MASVRTRPQVVLRASRALLAVSALAVGACAWVPPDLDAAVPDLAQSSRILAGDGSLLVELDAAEDRESVTLAGLPDHVPDAVVAIEDARYWSHGGVDGRAVLRAALANAEEGAVLEGGSTITQQYVKTVMLDSEQTLHRKLTEAALAVQLERTYSKARILELYLNTIYFGNGAYGIQAAARRYFGVAAAELDLASAATLAGLIRSPVEVDPYVTPVAARERRDVVLGRMDDLGLVTPEAAAAAKALPLLPVPEQPEARYPAPHFVEHVKRFVLDDPRFGVTPAERRAVLFGGGLRITTTLDPVLQAKAEDAVARTRPAEPGPDAALVAIEPATGAVRALVGGRDFFGLGAQARVDLAAGGDGRPAGSSFKPLVLALALEQGIRLDRLYPAPPRIEITLPSEGGPEEVWEVENYGESAPAEGEVSLGEATVRSYNTVYAQLIQDVGPEEAMSMAARLGIETPLAPYPSAVLGTNRVRPLDMAAAYATFANRGMRVPPAFVTRIVRADGAVLYAHRHTSGRVVSTGLADTVTEVLRGVVDRGTGTKAAIGRPAAGKTGTGQGWTDAWFVGYTPELATAVWMGYPDEGRRPMVPPATPLRVTGGSWPAEIWAGFMAAAHEGRPVQDFASAPSAGDPLVIDLVGQPAEAADDELHRAGFVVERRDVPSDDQTAGIVAATLPVAGARLALGSVIVLEVANGRPATLSVPDVFGRGPEEAADIVAAATFVPEVLVTAIGDGSPIPAGAVWRQEPVPGTRLAPGSVVRAWVTPPPAPPPTVPPAPAPAIEVIAVSAPLPAVPAEVAPG